ncbi:hypothetical protein F6Y05_02350 [Bacillus megaterium]|nr:hypothetical protein [Priestia megaterium]
MASAGNIGIVYYNLGLLHRDFRNMEQSIKNLTVCIKIQEN